MTAIQLNAIRRDIVRMLSGVSDEKALAQIASYIRRKDKEVNELRNKQLKPVTVEEYRAMIDDAEESYRKGDYISHEDMGKLVESWF